MFLVTFLGVSIAIGVYSDVYAACVFPAFIQTNHTSRNWWGQIRDQNNEFSTRIYVDERTLRVVASGSNAQSYTQVCLQQIQDAYLVAHEASHQDSARYMCVAFVQRTPNVIQLNTSTISHDMDATLCSRLQLDDWLIIDRDKVMDDVQECSLSGGFSVRVFDRRRREGVCDALDSNTRLESECLAGEGMTFYFRRQPCVPQELLMYYTQPTVCVANWEDGHNAFILLRHDTYNYLWVLRYPKDRESFVAYLMLDLVADRGRQITQTRSYLQLDTVRDTARPVTSLCVDDFEGCAVFDVCSPGHQDTMSCPRKCGYCNASRPAMCSFDTAWHGDWTDRSSSGDWQHGTAPGSVAVTVDTSTINVQHRVDETFHCIRWDNPVSGPQDMFTKTEMLVSDFNNGCRPRYSCAKFLHRSSSSVMFLKLSQSRLWPFTNSNDDPIDCSNFEYTNGDVSEVRSKHYRLLFDPSSRHGVQCDLPRLASGGFEATVPSGERCTGTLMEVRSGTGLSLVLSDCPSNPLHGHYTCVESATLFSSSDRVIVTRTASGDLHCWLFSNKHASMFYLLEAAHCNEASLRKIRNDRLVPLVSFVNHRLYGASTTPMHPGKTILPPSWESGGRPVTPPSGHMTISPDHRANKTDKPESTTTRDAIAAPVIVIGLVFFVGVSQLISCCKS